MNYTPDSWILLELEAPCHETPIYKVFASWEEDYWRLNSGIVDIKEEEGTLHILGESGSCYECLLKEEGYYKLTPMHGTMVAEWLKVFSEREGHKIRIIPYSKYKLLKEEECYNE